MTLIDTHCHLDHSAFDLDRTAILHRCAAAGVRAIVVPGVTAAHWPAVLALCAAPPPNGLALYPALGVHPLSCAAYQDADLQELAATGRRQPWWQSARSVWIFMAATRQSRNRDYLRCSSRIAQELDLPVLLHVRRAHDAVLLTLRRFPHLTGIVHAFNGSWQQAQQYLARGFKLGFGGMLTFTRATKLRRLAAELPLEALVLETDAPDMSGAAHCGERNSPEYLPDVLATLAQLRDCAAAELAAITTANARAVLRLP